MSTMSLIIGGLFWGYCLTAMVNRYLNYRNQLIDRLCGVFAGLAILSLVITLFIR